MDASQMGFWRIILATDLLEVSPRARLIHGIHPDEVLSYGATLSVVVPEHRERFQGAIAKAVETKGRLAKITKFSLLTAVSANGLTLRGRWS